MAISTIEQAMTRIKTALPHKPIAIFIVLDEKGKRQIDAVFGKTTGTLLRARKTVARRCSQCGQPVHSFVEEYLGDFNITHPVKETRKFLIQARGWPIAKEKKDGN